MRDPRFVARHRGGLLSPADHRRLMKWGRECAARVLPLTGPVPDPRLVAALKVAAAWERDEVPVGAAQKAAWSSHAVARGFVDPAAVAAARAVGHACATAHMADHSLGAALYALKALELAGRPTEAEKRRQLDRLPAALRPLVFRTLGLKGRPWGYSSPEQKPGSHIKAVASRNLESVYNGGVRRPVRKSSREAAMGTINKEWHLANRMPKNPTDAQRLTWHIEHSVQCDCRKPSDKLKAEIAAFKRRRRASG